MSEQLQNRFDHTYSGEPCFDAVPDYTLETLEPPSLKKAESAPVGGALASQCIAF